MRGGRDSLTPPVPHMDGQATIDVRRPGRGISRRETRKSVWAMHLRCLEDIQVEALGDGRSCAEASGVGRVERGGGRSLRQMRHDQEVH